jgi:hypothetical protein
MKFIALLPLRYNNGRLVKESIRRRFLSEALERFGGYSLEPGVQGGWRDETGHVWRDESFRLVISCDRSQYEEARQYVIHIGQVLEQEAMYFEVQYFDGVQILNVPRRQNEE